MRSNRIGAKQNNYVYKPTYKIDITIKLYVEDFLKSICYA